MRAPSAAALLVALTAGACGSATPAPSPTPSPTPSALPVNGPEGWGLLAGSPASPARARHDDLVFIDAMNGWLINVRGEVYRTQDGGASWQLLTTLAQPTFPRCVGFADAQHGWLGNINTTAGSIQPDKSLFETTDGGRTWDNISTRISGAPVIGLCGLRVVSPRMVAAVGRWGGPPVFVKTTDGGRTWSARSLSGLATGLVDLFFFNERDGFAVGGLGVGYSEAEQRASRTVVLSTHDGGETWDTRYASAAQGQWAWKIQFVDDHIGYVTTEGPTPEGVVLKTEDGGQTWRRLLVEPGLSFQGVAFVTPERGWVGNVDSLWATGDGGATWHSLRYAFSVNRMRVVGDALVYASGDRVYRWSR